ncbi:MAG: alpha/beta hydrolase [Pseudolysinimonas sp.]
MTHYLAELRDGRHIGITGLGDPAGGRLVLFCHPAPGAGGFDPDPPATATAGIRMIALDRPGYGGSETGPESPAPLDAWLKDLDEYLHTVEDVASVIANTDFGPIGVVGWGLGAMYATGLAVRHPELVDRLVLIEPTAPTEARLTAAEFEGAIDARLEALNALDGFLGASDRLGFMLDSARHGEGGMPLDRRVFTDPHWEKSLSSIRVSTLILSSDDSEGAWYQHRIQGARTFGTWSNPTTTIVEAWPEVLSFLTQSAD